MSRPLLELADLVRTAGVTFLWRSRHWIRWTHINVRCRTAALGGHIDTAVEDAGAVLQRMGGARAILATAPSGDAMGPLVSGLAARGKLIVVGVPQDQIHLSAFPLVFGGRSIYGSLAGTAIDTEDTLAFSVLENIRPMIETLPLEQAADAYARMMEVRELGIGVSCGGSGEKGWSTKLELGSGKSLDHHHGTATLGTEPKRVGWLNQGGLWFGRRRYCAEYLKANRQESGASAVGQEAEVANADEAFGKQVQQEAAQELIER